MNILFDIGHPAHVHYCRILAKRLEEQGWSCLFTTKDKQIVIYLLEHYGLDYVSCGKHKIGSIGKIWSLFSYTLRLFMVAIDFRPDFFFNASPSAAFVSWIMGKVHLGLEDTFNIEQVRLYMPFTDVVFTGDFIHPPLGKKEIRYPGYHELAYLHPSVFTPDERVLDCLGVKKGEKYAIVRFVAWNASHDCGHKGMSVENKITLVTELSKRIRVFISSEATMPDQLVQYRIPIRPEQMHDAMAYACLIVGESSTMASEAAVLGTPAIFMNNKHFGCTDDQSKYGVLFQYTESEEDQISLINKAVELASSSDKDVYQQKAIKMLKDKIDLSALLFWFVANYPESRREMRKGNFDFNRFK